MSIQSVTWLRVVIYILIGILTFFSYGVVDRFSHTRRKVEGIFFLCLALASALNITDREWFTFYTALILTPVTLGLLAVEILSLIVYRRFYLPHDDGLLRRESDK